MTDIFKHTGPTQALINEIRRDKYMQPDEKEWGDTHRRIAHALFPDYRGMRIELENQLESGRACPAGRVMAGAGTAKNVTWLNCFVSPLLQDSMRTDPNRPGLGIMDALSSVAYSMQMGGGVGTDFSTLRPLGALVRRVQAPASGPLAFADMWDGMCRTIMSAGERRGAMMATLRCDHPDIEAFITAKRTPGRLRMFNMSVLVTDAFMEAVAKDADWELGHWEPPFEGDPIRTTQRMDPYQGRAILPWHVYKVVKARALWDLIMQSNYAEAEPGVIFIDRVNLMNNLWYCEHIQCTNPCVTGDTLILTRDGYRFIDALVDKQVSVWNGQEWSTVVPRVTGFDQEIIDFEFSDGSHLSTTPYHTFYVNNGPMRAEYLVVGDKLDKWVFPVIDSGEVSDEAALRRAYTQGFYSGDGGFDTTVQKHRIWLYGVKRDLLPYLMHTNLTTMENRTDLVLPVGMQPKAFVPWDATYSLGVRLSWLAGLIDSDGTLNDPSGSISISSIDRSFLNCVKLMLNTLGVSGGLGLMSPSRPDKLMPDSKGGLKAYPVQDCWRLVISGSHISRLYELGLRCHRVPCNPSPQRDAARFIVVTSATRRSLPVDKVYCFNESKRHMGIFNGILTGQCGEQPLPPDQNCNLSHINLARCIIGRPFDECAGFGWDTIETVTRLLVRMSNNVIDLSPVPTDAQRKESQLKRRIGLGITGLANALMFLGVRYGSKQAVELTEAVMRTIRDAAYRESIEIAKEQAPFPAFDRDKYLEGEFIKSLPEDIRDGIADHGIRNALLLTIAPTGTISIAQADNSSGGIEPVYLARYNRKKLEADGSFSMHQIEDLGFRVYANAKFDGDMDAALAAPLPDYMVTTADLTPEDHLVMQAAAQKYVDSSISKTTNVPTDISFEAFTDIYRRAYELGCKGCTTYRPNPESKRGAVLSAVDEQTSTELVVHQPQSIRERPDVLHGRTYRLRWGDLPYPMFMTMNDEVTADGRHIPFEVFINSKSVDYAPYVAALTRMISAVMRKGGDLSFIPDELKQVWSARGGQYVNQRFVPSEIALIGLTIEKHFRDIGYLTTPQEDSPQPHGATYAELGIGKQCPSCGALQVIKDQGCDRCASCNWSNCG